MPLSLVSRETGTAHALNAVYEAERVVHTGAEPEIIDTVSERQGTEDRAVSKVQGGHLEQLFRIGGAVALRARRHTRRAGSPAARYSHLHLLQAAVGDAAVRREGRTRVLQSC